MATDGGFQVGWESGGAIERHYIIGTCVCVCLSKEGPRPKEDRREWGEKAFKRSGGKIADVAAEILWKCNEGLRS